MCTIESPIHLNVKKAIVAASEDDTELLLRRWRNTSRLYKNKVAKEAKHIENTSTTGKFEELAHLVSGKRGRQVFTTGDVEMGVRIALYLRRIPIDLACFRCGRLDRSWA